ncbi:MAG: AAA family ATPase [Planctomycetota bacterium]
MAEVTIFVLHPNEQYCHEVIEAYHQYDPELEMVAIADLREAPNRVREEEPGIVVVGVDTPNDPALRTIEAISEQRDEVGIVVVSKEPTQELLVSCMRAGSDEFLEFPIEPDELAATMDALFRRRGIGRQNEGKVIAVFSAAGGAGVTTVACNLGTALAEELGPGNGCCVVDMNLQFGSVALAMDLREVGYTLADVSREADRLDENLLSNFVTNHPSGAAVLPGPLSVTDLESVNALDLHKVVQTCRKSYRYVVLDMPHTVDECSIVGLDEADEILVVCDMVLPSIRNTIRALETFYELDYSREKMKLVINRFYDSDQVSLDEIVEHVNLPLHWLIPYDSEAVIISLNSGQTLEESGPGSQVTQSLYALAQHTAGISPRPKRKKKRSIFSWAR